MVNESRIDLYDYLYNIFYDVVTKNVYSMQEPQELTTSDTKDGFIVIRVGDIYDESEFVGQAYGSVRCYVEAFVPPITRGRLAFDRYKEYEDAITRAIKVAANTPHETYIIREGSALSMDGGETTNANNLFFTFVKSFIVDISEND